MHPAHPDTGPYGRSGRAARHPLRDSRECSSTCFLQVIVEEKDSGSYNRITSVIALPAGMDAPKTETPLIAFDIDAWDDEVFNSLPGWIQERIKKSTQYQKLHVPTDPVDVDTSGGQQAGTADSGQAQKEENPI